VQQKLSPFSVFFSHFQQLFLWFSAKHCCCKFQQTTSFLLRKRIKMVQMVHTSLSWKKILPTACQNQSNNTPTFPCISSRMHSIPCAAFILEVSSLLISLTLQLEAAYNPGFQATHFQLNFTQCIQHWIQLFVCLLCTLSFIHLSYSRAKHVMSSI
jgi:hypothetical protein